MLEGSQIVCPWHAWVFDVASGVSPVNPRAKIPTYPVKVEGKDVLVGL
jgi:nitrite reductase/ring-hydroxylating ferredoxin subunit